MNKNRSQMIERLRTIETFSTCTTRQFKQVDSLTTNLQVTPGRVLAREGRRASEFIVVLQGTATASREGLPIGRLGPGSLFGGLTLLDRAKWTASVIADTDMELLVSSLNEFWTMYRSIPVVSQEMSKLHRARNVGSAGRRSTTDAAPAAYDASLRGSYEAALQDALCAPE